MQWREFDNPHITFTWANLARKSEENGNASVEGLHEVS